MDLAGYVVSNAEMQRCFTFYCVLDLNVPNFREATHNLTSRLACLGNALDSRHTVSRRPYKHAYKVAAPRTGRGAGTCHRDVSSPLREGIGLSRCPQLVGRGGEWPWRGGAGWGATGRMEPGSDVLRSFLFTKMDRVGPAGELGLTATRRAAPSHVEGDGAVVCGNLQGKRAKHRAVPRRAGLAGPRWVGSPETFPREKGRDGTAQPFC